MLGFGLIGYQIHLNSKKLIKAYSVGEESMAIPLLQILSNPN
jgi:hypothetical protein